MNRGKYSKLFKPGRIGTVEVTNRIVMPPMTTNYATEKGFASDRIQACYEARATGASNRAITPSPVN